MKIGIISLGGKSSRRLVNKCKEYFDKADLMNLKDFKVHLVDGEVYVTYKNKELEDYDCIYIRGSYRYALLQQAIAKSLKKDVYMPLEPACFNLGHDKFLTLLELQKHNIPIPKTYYAATTDLAKKILERVNYPIIMKLPEGTHGKGVMMAESLESARTILDTLETFNKPYIIQEFVKTNGTSDIRAVVVGNKVLTAYQRVAGKGEIRTNIHSGGKRKKHLLTKEQEKIAIRSAKSIGAKICGVDIFNSKNPSVIEVNLSPALKSANKKSDNKLLKEIAKYLYLETFRFKEKKKERLKKKINKIAEGKNSNKSP